MARLLLACLLLCVAAPSFASPLNFAARLEKVWREETPVGLYKCKLVTMDQEWRNDVLASIVADYELGETDLYVIGRFGHRLDAEMNEGAVGIEYRFILNGCTSAPPPAAKPAPKPKRVKKPCP